MSQRRKPRVAIVGGGMISKVHHRAARLAGAEIVAVLGVDPEHTRMQASEWEVPHAPESMDALLELKPDIVHIASPNATHPTYAIQALDAGVSVICEKPIATDLNTARVMAAAAERAAAHGAITAVPFIYRYHPVVREIRERRLAGRLGRTYAVHGSYLQDWMLPKEEGNWRVDPEVGGASRAFADIGSHWFDLAEWVSGERVETLSAVLSIAIDERPQGTGSTFGSESATSTELFPVSTEDIAMVTGRTRAGVPIQSTISQVSGGRKNRLWLEIDGADGSAAFDQEQPELGWFGGFESTELFVRNPGAGTAEQRRLSVLPAGHSQGFAMCFEAFVADVYETMGGNDREIPTFADGLRAAALTEAVLRAAREQAWTAVAG